MSRPAQEGDVLGDADNGGNVSGLRRQKRALARERDTMYEWIKALHVIAVIAWMAGMLYLPRLFVYHCEAEAGSKQSETFKVMERRLLRAIVNPAMIRDSEPGQGPQFGLLRPLKRPGSALVSP
jgi:hypothetical protein